MAELLQSQPAGAAVAPGQPQPETVSRWAIFAHAVFFVLGFTFIFTLMGSAAGLLGRNLNRELMELLQKFGAIMLVIFGLATLGVFRWLVGLITARVNLATNPAAEALVSLLEFPNKLLYTEKRVTGMHQVNRKWGYFSSSLWASALPPAGCRASARSSPASFFWPATARRHCRAPGCC